MDQVDRVESEDQQVPPDRPDQVGHRDHSALVDPREMVVPPDQLDLVDQ